MIGKTLLHYEITAKIGEGGMGIVYKAKDSHLDRFVAIKVLPPERVSDPTRKARFVQEAKAASALKLVPRYQGSCMHLIQHSEN